MWDICVDIQISKPPQTGHLVCIKSITIFEKCLLQVGENINCVSTLSRIPFYKSDEMSMIFLSIRTHI